MSNCSDNFVTAANTPNNSDFIDSLDSLTVEDIVPPHAKKSKKKSFSFFKLSRLLVVFLCIAVFIYCMSELTTIVNDYRRGDSLYGEIQKEYYSYVEGNLAGSVTNMNTSASDVPMANYDDVKINGITIYEPPKETIDRVTSSAKFMFLLSLIEELRDTNKDTYGYINIPNTKVNYPLVQRGDNDYYLTHAFDGHSLAVGAIFVDFRNLPEIEKNRNIVIYGHNMLNGSMFCDVTKYVLNEDFFMNPKNDIEITTFDGHYTFRVFSAYTTNKYDNYFKTYFPSGEEFVKFCEEREEKSHYSKEDMTFSEDDVIITLSTCILGNDDGRYAIHAKLIKVET